MKNIRYFTALIAITMLAACQPQDSTDQETKHGVKADDIVMLSTSAFGCESEMEFLTAIKHYANKEYAAWADTVADKIRCFTNGGSDKKSWKWTVYQVKGDVMQVGFASAEQVAQDSERYSHKYWTMTKWIVTTGYDPYESWKKRSDAELNK